MMEFAKIKERTRNQAEQQPANLLYSFADGLR